MTEPTVALPGVLEDEGQKILSGLSEVDLDPTGVDALYQIDDPLALTPAQRAVVIESIRRSRAETKRKTAVRKRKKLEKDEAAKLTLEDLDLELKL